jgi:uncharacterized membrane protein
MTLGPLDYLVVGFPGNQFKGEIAPAIAEASAKGIIRLVDVVFVMKDENGATTMLEINDLPDELKEAFAAVAEDAHGLFTPEDVATLTDTLPPNNSALIMLYEHLWAIKIKEALLNANGVLIAQGRIAQEAHADIDDELDAQMEATAKLHAGADGA